MRKAKRNRSDFFIDYADADGGWAEWVAWQLEDAGYTVLYRAKDFRAGMNVVERTDEEMQRAERVIILFSPEYLRVYEAKKTSSCVQVWTAAFMQSGKLMPLRVRPCRLKGLLQPLIPIELADQNEMQARKVLLDGVSRELPRSREKPPFPGDAQPERDRPVFPPISRPAFWEVPSENPFFTDRDDELMRLYELLHEGSGIRKYVINGLGGVGKTQVGLAYAHEYKYRYQAVLWVDARNERTLEASTSRLLDALKVRLVGPQRRNKQSVERTVRRWLEDHDNWLLIFDDIEDIQSVREMLPTSGNGYVLYTTRTQIIGATASAALPLNTLRSEDGALFLLRRSRQIQDATLEHLSEQSRTEVLQLSRLLGDLPLMLDQAGACIEDTGLDVANYLQWYSNAEGRHTLLRRRGDVTVDHPESVVETWDAAFAALQQSNPAAYDLLQLCAFLYQDAIPEEVINRGAVELLPTFQAFAQPSPGRAEVFSALRRYSLLTQDTSARTLSMNRVVQEVLKDKMSSAERRLWAERAIIAVARALLDSVQSDGPTPGWQCCPRYIDHVHVCTLHMQEWSLAPTEAVLLLSAMGKYLHAYAQAQHAAPGSIERTQLIGTLEGYAAMLEKMNQRAEAGEIMGYVAMIQAISA